MTAAALELLDGLVLEDGHRWGEVAAPFQVDDARAILDDGRPFHFLTRARGASKTCDLAGVALVAMLTQLPASARVYAFAADRDQARLLIDALGGFVRRTPGLGGAVTLDAFKVTSRQGVVLEAVAADDASAYGLRGALFIVDELAQWPWTGKPQRLWEAIVSAVPKVPGARLVVLTTAGDPAHWSRKVFDSAAGSPMWRVHEEPGPVPWISADQLVEQRRLLMPSSFARLHLNQWTAAEDRLVSPDDLAACVTLDGPLPPQPGRTYVAALDVGLKNDRTVLAACHSEPADDGSKGMTVVLDRMAVWQGTRAAPVPLGQVEATLIELHRSYRPRKFLVDPWQAAQLVQRMRARGLPVEEFVFTAQSVGRLASTLHQLLRSRSLALPDDSELLDELATVRLRETSPGVVRLDHDPSRHDDRAVTLAMCAHELVQRSGRSSGHSNARDLVSASLSDSFLHPSPCRHRKRSEAMTQRRF